MIFSEAHIENFRGIRQCKIDKLGMVNVFFGKNNCGKSSLLEAFFLLSGQSNPLLPVNINSFRGIGIESEQDLLPLFYQADRLIPIRIEGKGDQKRSLSIELTENEDKHINLDEISPSDTEAGKKKYGLKLTFSLGEQDKRHSAVITLTDEDNGKGKEVKIERDKSYKENIIAEYISPNNVVNNPTENLKAVILNKQEKEILELLKVVEPRINDIQVVGQKILVDIGSPVRLPINVLGDGTRKLLSVILAIYRRKNGAIMIDELENGLHYSVMGKLWEAILHTSRKTNTQLFISTHSIDILKSLVDTIGKHNGNMPAISAYKLVRKENDELVALRYESDQLCYVINQDVEVR